MPEPAIAPLVRNGWVEPEIVENGRSAGCKQADRRVDVILGVVRVDEQEVETGPRAAVSRARIRREP